MTTLNGIILNDTCLVRLRELQTNGFGEELLKNIELIYVDISKLLTVSDKDRMWRNNFAHTFFEISEILRCISNIETDDPGE